MSLFQRSFYTPADQTFTNLFRLLDDFDTYSSAKQPGAVAATTRGANGQQQHPSQQQLTARQLFGGHLFSPRFDVRETGKTYELHGELAGLDKKDVSLEFTEPQTLVVSGHVERKYETGTPEEEASAAAAPAEKETPATPPHATVTDEAEEAALEKGQPEAAVAKKAEAAAAAPAERYWYQERSVGDFQRTFTFPQPVDEASVTATLDNGILNISVPKAVKRESRRIAVN